MNGLLKDEIAQLHAFSQVRPLLVSIAFHFFSLLLPGGKGGRLFFRELIGGQGCGGAEDVDAETVRGAGRQDPSESMRRI